MTLSATTSAWEVETTRDCTPSGGYLLPKVPKLGRRGEDRGPDGQNYDGFCDPPGHLGPKVHTDLKASLVAAEPITEKESRARDTVARAYLPIYTHSAALRPVPRASWRCRQQRQTGKKKTCEMAPRPADSFCPKATRELGGGTSRTPTLLAMRRNAQALKGAQTSRA